LCFSTLDFRDISAVKGFQKGLEVRKRGGYKVLKQLLKLGGEKH